MKSEQKGCGEGRCIFKLQFHPYTPIDTSESFAGTTSELLAHTQQDHFMLQMRLAQAPQQLEPGRERERVIQNYIYLYFTACMFRHDAGGALTSSWGQKTIGYELSLIPRWPIPTTPQPLQAQNTKQNLGNA
jgi:hypothetical protein